MFWPGVRAGATRDPRARSAIVVAVALSTRSEREPRRKPADGGLRESDRGGRTGVSVDSRSVPEVLYRQSPAGRPRRCSKGKPSLTSSQRLEQSTETPKAWTGTATDLFEDLKRSHTDESQRRAQGLVPEAPPGRVRSFDGSPRLSGAWESTCSSRSRGQERARLINWNGARMDASASSASSARPIFRANLRTQCGRNARHFVRIVRRFVRHPMFTGVRTQRTQINPPF